MAKQWPDFMGNYKGIVLETGMGKTKTSGMPQFIAKVYLTEYYDQKEQQWYDVSENNWTLNTYLSLYGRKDSQPDGEIVETLNHQQVCKVFGWDGRGFAYLAAADFNGKIVQVRVAENTYEDAKSPVQVVWIDTEDADPNQGLQKLDAKGVKDLEAEFSKVWAGKAAPKVTVAKAPVTKAAPKAEAPKAEEPPAEAPKDKKATLLEKAKRLKKAQSEEAKKVETPKAAPAKGKKVPEPTKAEEPSSEAAIPDGYNKKAAWNDVCELKSDKCDDAQVEAAWLAAIAEIAEDGDEDKLDAAGWWAVKESTLNDVGVL